MKFTDYFTHDMAANERAPTNRNNCSERFIFPIAAADKKLARYMGKFKSPPPQKRRGARHF